MAKSYHEIVEFLKHHAIEIIFAIIFAIIFGIIVELYKFREKLKKRDKSLTQYYREKLKRLFDSDRPKKINTREIERSISTQINKLDRESTVFSIDKKGVLSNKDKSHYEVDGYHFERFLNVLPVLDGDEQFFVQACRSIGDILRTSEIDCILYLEKDTDSLFCREVINQSLPDRTKVYSLGYKNQPKAPKVVYRENDALEGQNVAVVTALALSDKPLVALSDFVRKQGAQLEGVAILFDAIYDLVDLKSLLNTKVISAIYIDLKSYNSESGCCKLCSTKSIINRLGFNDY